MSEGTGKSKAEGESVIANSARETIKNTISAVEEIEKGQKKSNAQTKNAHKHTVKCLITRTVALIEYHIFKNGTINYRFVDCNNDWVKSTQEFKDNRKQAKYFYYKSNDFKVKPYIITPDPVDITVIKTSRPKQEATWKERNGKNQTAQPDILGGKHIYLVSVENILTNTSSDLGFAWEINCEQYERFFGCDVAMASLIGAMLSTGYKDFVYNGGCNVSGDGNPSISHGNGRNLDTRYLLNDNKFLAVHLSNEIHRKMVDIKRQNTYNDALYTFGWENLLGWVHKGTDTPINLNHVTHHDAHGDHIHGQSYDPKRHEMSESENPPPGYDKK